MTLVAAMAVGYLLGSVPFALLIARGWGEGDLRVIGSGNPGAANTLRAGGVRAGLMVAALDVAKGAASVLVAQRLGEGLATPVAAGVAAIVGHVYPAWLSFRGGKGVATSCGVFAVLTPAALLPALALFVVTVWITKYISLGSMIATVTLPIVAYAIETPPVVIDGTVLAAALILFRHRTNMARIWAGTERTIGQRLIR